METKQQTEIRTSTEGGGILSITSHDWEKERNLLIKAINNRTRERNFANLCLRLSEGEITEEEYDEEIEKNEEHYVISFDEMTSPEEIRMATLLTDRILNVDTVDDFKELFSVSSLSLSMAQKALGNNG